MKKSETIVIGKIIKKYKIPLKHINELNKKYDSVKNKLNDYGDRLAGRLDTELNITSILQQTSIYPYLVKCMTDYINDEQRNCLIPAKRTNKTWTTKEKVFRITKVKKLKDIINAQK